MEHKWTDGEEYHYGHVQMGDKQTLADCFFGLLDTQYGIKDFGEVLVAMNCTVFQVGGKTVDPEKTFKQLKMKSGDVVKAHTKKYHAVAVIDMMAPPPKAMKVMKEAKHKMMPPDFKASMITITAFQ